MKKLNITLTAILLVLGCFLLSPRCKQLATCARADEVHPNRRAGSHFYRRERISTRKATSWEPMLTAASDFTVFC